MGDNNYCHYINKKCTEQLLYARNLCNTMLHTYNPPTNLIIDKVSYNPHFTDQHTKAQKGWLL